MLEITYIQVDDITEKKIAEKYGDWIYKYDCMPKGEGTCRVAAVSKGEVIGFATLKPYQWTTPLDMYHDAYICSIEVDEAFQRRGIGRHLVGMLEKWAKDYGYRQIRAWSSHDKVAALHMWYALDYGMCPATNVIKSTKPNEMHLMLIDGYFYAKVLNSSCPQLP